MAEAFLTEEAKAYEEWVEEFEKRTEYLPRADYETHEGAMAAYTLLKRINRVCLLISFMIVGGMVASYGLDVDIATWAINYSGDFMKITPFRIDK